MTPPHRRPGTPQASLKMEGTVALPPQFRCGPSRWLHEHSGLPVWPQALTGPLLGPIGRSKNFPSPLQAPHSPVRSSVFLSMERNKADHTCAPQSVCLCCWVAPIKGSQATAGVGGGVVSQGWAPGSLDSGLCNPKLVLLFEKSHWKCQGVSFSMKR